MFEQYAKDSFTVEVAGPYHCGPDDTSPKRFDYEVLLKYPPDALDDKGFLLDNLDFKNYFDSLQRCEISCEQLARQACRYFTQAAGGRAAFCKVDIWGIPGKVKVSCQWPEPTN